MIVCNKQGEIIAVYSVGSEPHQRYWMVMDILHNAARCYHEKALIEKEQRRLSIEDQIDKSDKKILLKQTKRSIRRYNLTQTAHILKVHRQTIYYWIKQGRVKPKRDFRGYPVFTVLDIERLIEWKETVKC